MLNIYTHPFKNSIQNNLIIEISVGYLCVYHLIKIKYNNFTSKHLGRFSISIKHTCDIGTPDRDNNISSKT